MLKAQSMEKEKGVVTGYLLILYYLGLFSILVGFMILSPLLLTIFWHEEFRQAIFFVIPAGIAFVFGLSVMLSFKGKTKIHLQKKHDAVLVVFIWLFAIFFSALPFYLSGELSFVQSIFEATSGYSTTGLTVVDVENLPHTFLFFRSLMQLFGGVGLILLLTSFVIDKAGVRLYQAEGHVDRLLPNLIRSARAILLIYLFYIGLGTILYVIFGMPLFDAVNHSISAVATGGFSVRTESIGYYQSFPIEIITIILMILGGTNFYVHLLMMKRKFKLAFNHVELKLIGLLTLLFVPLFILSLMRFNNLNFFEASRIGIFHFFSAITTTGLQTVPNMQFFPAPILFHLIIIMMIGAGIGSTAGGMKLYRVSLALKSSFWDLKEITGNKKLIRPHFLHRLGEKVKIDASEVNKNYTFLFVYLIILCIGISIYTFEGYGFTESIFEFTSTLGTIGLSYGIIGSNPSPLILWTTIVGMLFARLESYIIIIAFTKIFIDFKRAITKM